jgi:hypothetical protein
MAAMVIFVWHLREATRLQSLCESELFHAYEVYAEKMTELQNLNPKALRLRQQLKQAQLMLQAALISGNAVRIATAERRLAQVEFARTELAATQNKIFTSIQMAREQNLVRIRHRFYPDIKALAVPHLAVHADVPGDIAPVYLENTPYENNQAATLHYYLREPLHGRRTTTRECRVSLEKRRTRYMPKLAWAYQGFRRTKC